MEIEGCLFEHWREVKQGFISKAANEVCRELQKEETRRDRRGAAAGFSKTNQPKKLNYFLLTILFLRPNHCSLLSSFSQSFP